MFPSTTFAYYLQVGGVFVMMSSTGRRAAVVVVVTVVIVASITGLDQMTKRRIGTGRAVDN